MSPDGRHEVAIKMLKPDATEEDRLKLLQEAAIMGQFSHKNVVKLHGVVTIGDPVSNNSDFEIIKQLLINFDQLFYCYYL